MFCICIPTVNRKDLLVEALPYYCSLYPTTNIYVLDNGHQNIPQLCSRIYIFESEENLGVARSWTFLINKAIENGESNFLVLNDDIIYKRGQGFVNALIEKHGAWTFHQPRPIYNWSIFLISKEIYQKVGEFDSNFKRCFYEDNDYMYRLKLSGINVRYEDEFAPEVYRCSETTKRSPELGGYLENRAYYLEKWGGLPHQERYTFPFNKSPLQDAE